MFNLNEAVCQWRREMEQAGTCGRDDLDELESHLRDETASLRKTGLSEEESFLVAMRRLGSAAKVGVEFCKINPLGLWRHRLYWMAVGVVAYMCVSYVRSTFDACSVMLLGAFGMGPQSFYMGLAIGNAVCATALILGGVWLARRGMRLPEMPRWTADRKGRAVLAGAAVLLVVGFGLASGYLLRVVNAGLPKESGPDLGTGAIMMLSSLPWALIPLVLLHFLFRKRDWGRTPVLSA